MPKDDLVPTSQFLRALAYVSWKALPALLICAAVFLILLKLPRTGPRFKRGVLVAMPLFPAVLLLGHPWQAHYAKPFWLLCSQFVGLPTIVLFRVLAPLGIGVPIEICMLISAAWIIGLTVFLFKKARIWFP